MPQSIAELLGQDHTRWILIRVFSRNFPPEDGVVKTTRLLASNVDPEHFHCMLMKRTLPTLRVDHKTTPVYFLSPIDGMPIVLDSPEAYKFAFRLGTGPMELDLFIDADL